LKYIVGLILTITLISLAIGQNLVVAGRGVAIDGDTSDLNRLNIRLKGIAVPGLNEKGGQAAKLAIEKLLKHKAIRYSLPGQKSYKRHLGTYCIGQLNIAASLITGQEGTGLPKVQFNLLPGVGNTDFQNIKIT
jgi:hypothetical protein